MPPCENEAAGRGALPEMPGVLSDATRIWGVASTTVLRSELDAFLHKAFHAEMMMGDEGQ
jgi:hypothetical protein